MFMYLDATVPTVLYTLSLHDALPIYSLFSTMCDLPIPETRHHTSSIAPKDIGTARAKNFRTSVTRFRSEEHTSELQSRFDLVCRLLLEKKKKRFNISILIALETTAAN